MLLVISLYLGMKTRRVDQTKAFVQALIETKVYIEYSKQFEREGYFLRLKRSMTGNIKTPTTSDGQIVEKVSMKTQNEII